MRAIRAFSSFPTLYMFVCESKQFESAATTINRDLILHAFAEEPRQTDRQTDTDREREREGVASWALHTHTHARTYTHNTQHHHFSAGQKHDMFSKLKNLSTGYLMEQHLDVSPNQSASQTRSADEKQIHTHTHTYTERRRRRI